MRTWLTVMIFGCALSAAACNNKDAAEGEKTTGTTEQPAPATGDAASADGKDAGAAPGDKTADGDDKGGDEIPTPEDFEEAAARDVTKDNLDDKVKALEEELGEE